MILFCLPYAGGSESIYYKWRNYLDPSIQLSAIELKGRGKRYNETFYENIEEAVNDIFDSIKEKILSDDYAIYGHSMGSLLAYELYYKIIKMKYIKPKHMFFSAYKAPCIIKKRECTYNLPDNEFMQKVLKYGGMSEEIVNNNELLKLFLPILKSDFKILETYDYIERVNKIESDISVFSGTQDSISREEMLEWKKHVCKGFNHYRCEGGHL